MSKKKKQRRLQRKQEKAKALKKASKPTRTLPFLYPILVLLTVVGAFLLRVLPSWGKIFVGNQTYFREVDPYFQMRLVDAMLHNFPNFIRHDMFTLYPSGGDVGFGPVLTFLVAFPSWVIGLGHPSLHLVSTIGALVPPILAAGVCLIIYFLGKELSGSKRVGLIAAVLASVLPGEYFFRSLLGFTDQHILEVFLTSLTLLLVVIGLRKKSLRWAILAGLIFGLYQVAWHGGIFFIFILWIWFVVQYFWDLRKAPNTFLCKFTFVLFLLACIPILWYDRELIKPLFQFKVLVTLVSVGTPLILYVLSRALKSKRAIVLTFLAISLFAATAALSLYGGLIIRIKDQLMSVFWGWGATISEAQPTDLPTAFEYFGIPFLLTFVGFFLLARKKPNMLLFVWTVILLAALIGQRRWCYYYAVPVSIMSAICIERVTELVKPKAQTAVLIILILFTFLPSIHSTWGLANIPNQITPTWYSSLTWLRANSPDPFTTQDAYYKTDLKEEPSYGVLCWWDFGHWITYIAHRAPISNPAYQDTYQGSAFFTSRTPEEAEATIKGWNIKYIILSEDVLTGKWYAVIGKAKKPGLRVEESVAYMLWQNKYPGYNLVHQEGEVRIYEKVE